MEKKRVEKAVTCRDLKSNGGCVVTSIGNAESKKSVLLFVENGEVGKRSTRHSLEHVGGSKLTHWLSASRVDKVDGPSLTPRRARNESDTRVGCTREKGRRRGESDSSALAHVVCARVEHLLLVEQKQGRRSIGNSATLVDGKLLVTEP